MHMDMLVATDFFTAEVWTSCGLVTYYVLFFIHLASRGVHTTQKQSRGAGPFLGKGPIECRERLGGLLKYYYRDAA